MSSPSSHPGPGAGSRIWRILVLLAVLLVCAAAYLQRPRPGRTTVTYRIGKVDARFGLTREEVSEAARSAVAIWRAPVARELFREDPRGDLVIDLVYDRRQETLDKLKVMHQDIQASKGSIENLKLGYEGLKADYEQKRDMLDDAFAAYRQKVAEHNAAGEALRGRATADEVQRLKAGKAELDADFASLKRREADLDETRAALNAHADEVNRKLAGERAQVAGYHATGDTLKEEFDEGLYTRRWGRQTITVYSFSSPRILVRVLAHELGHALGIGHVKDPRAIMYPMMVSDSLDLAPEDLAALRERCGLQ